MTSYLQNSLIKKGGKSGELPFKYTTMMLEGI